MSHFVKIIQQSQIENLHISPTDCIQWVEEGFRMKDDVQLPAKLSVHPHDEDFITTMPCLLPEKEGVRFFGVKIVSRVEGHVPALQSEIYLYDAKTGQLKAILDGDWITAMRTGAVAALSARMFQKAGVDTYSMIGLGNIARAVLLCLAADNQHRSITVRLMQYKDQAESFAEYFSNLTNVRFEIVDDKKDFVSQADVVISCVTVAKELLFPDDSLFRMGVTVIPVHMRGFQNCDLFFDKVFGDDTGQIRQFRYFSQFKQYDEFHHVLLGQSPGRTSSKERILSYNYGLALHDIFFASKIYSMLVDADCLVLNKNNKKIWM